MVIDADYYNNPDNEGHIYFQMINLSPFDIVLHKDDVIGQGILKKYYTTDDDAAQGERTGGFGSTSQQRAIDKATSCNPWEAKQLSFDDYIKVQDSFDESQRALENLNRALQKMRDQNND